MSEHRADKTEGYEPPRAEDVSAEEGPTATAPGGTATDDGTTTVNN